MTGARRGASYPPFPIQPEPPLEDELLPEEVVDPPELDDGELEDEPESRGTAEPVVGASAGRERSCACTGARLSVNAVAATPIVNL